MAINYTWAVSDMEHNLADGKVQVVHYTISADDGTYSTGAYGSFGFDGEISTPYLSLTSDIVIGWVKDQLGPEKILEIEQSLAEQIELQHNPKTGKGKPWE